MMKIAFDRRRAEVEDRYRSGEFDAETLCSTLDCINETEHRFNYLCRKGRLTPAQRRWLRDTWAVELSDD